MAKPDARMVVIFSLHVGVMHLSMNVSFISTRAFVPQLHALQKNVSFEAALRPLILKISITFQAPVREVGRGKLSGQKCCGHLRFSAATERCVRHWLWVDYDLSTLIFSPLQHASF